ARVDRRSARPLREPFLHGRPQLLEPGGSEEPLAGALDRPHAFVELVRGEERPRGEVGTPDRRLHRRADDRGGVAAVEQPEAVEDERASRGWIEDATAAERRPVAQDDAVAAGRDDGRRKTELRVRPAGSSDAGDALARP